MTDFDISRFEVTDAIRRWIVDNHASLKTDEFKQQILDGKQDATHQFQEALKDYWSQDVTISRAVFQQLRIKDEELCKLLNVIKMVDNFFEVTVSKMNVKESALDANAITAWNETECAVSEVKRKYKGTSAWS